MGVLQVVYIDDYKISNTALGETLALYRKRGKMYYDPRHNEAYRRQTATNFDDCQMMQFTWVCSVCKRKTHRASKIKGTGTSRFNPAKWICRDCKEKQSAGS